MEDGRTERREDGKTGGRKDLPMESGPPSFVFPYRCPAEFRPAPRWLLRQTRIRLRTSDYAGWRSTVDLGLEHKRATVDEVASMIVYVCSAAASATTGAALRVDGGVVRSIA